MFEILFYLFFWFTYSSSIKRYSANVCTATYAIIYVFLYILYTEYDFLLYDLYFWSMSYFIYDCIRVIRASIQKGSMTDMGLVAHHLIAIYFVHDMGNLHYPALISYVLYLGEMSNIPGFITYYFIKEEHPWRDNSVLIQTGIYSYIRIYLMCELMINIGISYFPFYYVLLYILLYTMGFIWSVKLMRQSLQILGHFEMNVY